MSENSEMRRTFNVGLSKKENSDEAIPEVCERASFDGGERADVTFCFVSNQYGPEFGEFAGDLYERANTEHLIGCSGESIVGEDQEVEQEPAVSIWRARFDDESVEPARIEFKQSPDEETFSGWPPAGVDEPDHSTLFLFGDPFSFPADKFLERINREHDQLRVVGGLSSGGNRPGQNTLFMDGEALRTGAVGLFVENDDRIRSVVSQGCRPIGPSFVVTGSDDNLLTSLGGEPPLTRLQDVLEELPEEDRRLAQNGLHIGVVIDEKQDSFDRGDFLIRGVLGVDQESGAMQVGDRIKKGRTVQFQVRDAESADRDLNELLENLASEEDFRPGGALLFTCNGRGSRFFDRPHHDVGEIQKHFKNLPVSGFFARGELGPVSGENSVHGYTASIAFFGSD